MNASTLEAPVVPDDVTGAALDDLKQSDRCDRCKAQAFMLIKKDGKQRLFLCAHHGREHTPVLLAKGFEVLDFSFRLNEKPTSPDIDDI